MWEDDISWQYHQNSRDAAANKGAIVFFAMVVGALVAIATSFIF